MKMELSGDHGIYWYYFGSILHGEMKGELDSWLPCPVCDSRQETSERKAIFAGNVLLVVTESR